MAIPAGPSSSAIPTSSSAGQYERPVDDLLRSRGINRVILDSRALFDRRAVTEEEIDAWDKKPRLPVRPIATSTRPIVRLIGSSDLDASLERWTQWVPTIVRWLTEGRAPSIFTHTPDNVDALPLARRFHTLVADAAEDAGQPRPNAPEPRTADEQLAPPGSRVGQQRVETTGARRNRWSRAGRIGGCEGSHGCRPRHRGLRSR